MTPSEQTEKNIRAIYEREKREQAKVPASRRAAHRVADFAGTIAFGVINAVFFAVWIGLNLTLWRFDPYPFTLLITIVSLEAIFLTVIVLVSQNQMTQMQDRRNNLDLQVNLLLEQETTELCRVVLLMAERMGIDSSELEALAAMTEETSPEEVLQKIDDIQKEKP